MIPESLLIDHCFPFVGSRGFHVDERQIVASWTGSISQSGSALEAILQQEWKS
jgi:hypothetical protein